MGNVQGIQCCGEMPVCYSHSRVCVGADFASSNEADAEEVWAKMPVVALKALEDDRIDPWLRRRPRSKWHGSQVVADTMGPDAVLIQTKGPNRASSPGSSISGRLSVKSHGTSNLILEEVINPREQPDCIKQKSGLSGMASRSSPNTATGDSDEADADCELEQVAEAERSGR
mmetsp:Transcript_40269/g.120452  ORF Transcript_40269/g.120452 Transcript_40269/m.120452 type:complete len:172 (-) Transcript_40269:99-614(-)|eukprot:CAMPEP_0175209252 /NCGR_PEP_ID=MMETSP0093-20121207/14037_1 /TAXON_ID=311494 /ORGANISM="Alexandrium monilatum, Strain CCMP3105" /LENGTH=171 /DNA_ID=CAMNT_0016502451 /DNA_START=44 /DNA_END=559 /DNA_ORIENTATION=-